MEDKITISVSTAKVIQACPMQYYIGSVVGLRQPQTPAQKIGTIFAKLTEALAKGHVDINDYLKESEVVKELFWKNVDFLNKQVPKETTEAEKELLFGINLYISFKGYIDAVIETEQKIIIRDFKTTSDWKWSLTEKELESDEQLNIYAYFVNRFYNPKNKPIWIEQQQFNKKTGARRSPCIPWNQVAGEQVYDWMVLMAEKALVIRRTKVEEIEQNWDNCDKFNGCAYKPYCNKKCSLEGLDEMLNPNVKTRDKVELKNLTVDDRLDEVKKEVSFNKNLNLVKGVEGMDAISKIKALKAKMEADRNNVTDVFAEAEKKDVVKDAVVTEKVEALPQKEDVTPPVVTEPEKRKRRTKAELDVEKEALKKTIATINNPMPVDLGITTNIPTSRVEVMEPRTVIEKPLLLIGCSILEDDKNHPSDFLHEQFVEPVLKAERIPHISCSEFSKANKAIMLYSSSILKVVKEYSVINIDLRRPVDALVYTMIMDLDRDSFRIVRSTF